MLVQREIEQHIGVGERLAGCIDDPLRTDPAPAIGSLTVMAFEWRSVATQSLVTHAI